MFDALQPYSIPIIAGILFVVIGLLFLRNKPRLPEVIALGVIALALGIVYFYLRPVQTPLTGEAAEVQAMIGQGQPVLLEFQSPY